MSARILGLFLTLDTSEKFRQRQNQTNPSPFLTLLQWLPLVYFLLLTMTGLLREWGQPRVVGTWRPLENEKQQSIVTRTLVLEHGEQVSLFQLGDLG
jgi:hypothetical protein